MNRIRFLKLLLVLASLGGSIAIALAGMEAKLSDRGAARFVWDTIIGQPGGFTSFALQLGVIALLHAALLWATFALACVPSCFDRQRWYGRPTFHVIATWFAMAWVLVDANNAYFPHSIWLHVLGPITDSPGSMPMRVLVAIWLVVKMVDAARALSSRYGTRRSAVVAIAATVVVALPAVAVIPPLGFLTGDSMKVPRNVIVIGLDSIRRDFLTDPRLQPLMPTLNAVASDGHVELGVVSPLANTFPAWTTILTGLHPLEHGARYNLTAQGRVATDASLAHHFRNLGYRTIYATDETRFSNIGARFGFDEVVGPEAGVADFLLAQYVDLPLVNLFVQLPRAEWLLPALAGNRAFSHAYEPSRFLDRLANSIGYADGRPTFIAVHLCTDHWPFRMRRMPGSIGPGVQTPDTPYYRLAGVVDRQFSELRALLKAQGYLDDRALEVVLADHGEATPDLDEAPTGIESMTETDVLPGPEFGHGSSLLSAAQWRVFTIFRGAGVAGVIVPARSSALHSLEDIAPTIRALTDTVAAKQSTSRMDVRPLLTNVRPRARKIVVMETGLTPEGFNPVNPDGGRAIRIAEQLFAVQRDGRIELRDDVHEASIANKQIGVTDGERALISLSDKRNHMLVEQDFASGNWRLFDSRQRPADPSDQPALIVEACRISVFAERSPGWCRL